MSNPAATPEYLLPDEVATLLRCRPEKIYRLCATRELPSIRFGGRRLIDRNDLNRFIVNGPKLVRAPRDRHGRRHQHEPIRGESANEWVVYVIESDYGVKVGISDTGLMHVRLYALESSSGLPLRMIRVYRFPSKAAARAIERDVHERLASSRTLGEWFHCHPFDATAVLDRIYADSRRKKAA